MDFDTIRAALGELQHDADSSDAWNKLLAACGADLASSADPSHANELTKLLGAARAEHGRRGEWSSVARLIELELRITSNDEDSAQLLMELGRINSHELLDEDAADRAYQLVLQRHPDDELATVALLESAERRGQWQERVKAYATEAESAPDDVYKASMLMRVAEAEWRFAGEERDEQRVLRLLAEATEADPRNAGVLQMLELIYRKQHAWAELGTVLERWATYGADETARLAAAVRLARLQSHQLENPVAAAAAYELALAVDPSHPEAKAALSEHYASAENWGKLVQLYERDLGAAEQGRVDRLGDMLQIAMLHYKKRAVLADAAPWFQRIRELEPSNSAMLSFYRDYSTEIGDEALLLSVLQGAQRVLPEGSEKQGVTREIAQLAEGQQDAQKAIEQYNSLLRQDPDNREAADALKSLYRKTQGYAQLVDMLRHELERLVPEDKERRVALLREVAGVYREHLNNDTSLVSALNQLLQVDDQDVDAIRELIVLYERLGRWRDLLANQQRLAQLTTDADEKVSLLRAAGRRWLEQFSNVQNATAAFEELLRAAPQDREARDTLAQLYKKRRAWSELYTLYEAQLPSLTGAARLAVMKEMAALAAERLKKGAEAAQLYKGILQEEPGNSAVLDALEKHAERTKDYATLSDVLEQRIIAEQEPRQRIVLLQKLGVLSQEQLHDAEASSNAWRRILEIEPRHPRAMRVLRDKLLEEGAYEELEQLYVSQEDFEGLAEVLSSAADNTTNLRNKIDLSYRAAKVFEQRIGSPERSFRSYERILSCDPLDARAARALVPLYEADEKWPRLPPLYELVISDSTDESTRLAWYAKLVEVTGSRLNDRESALTFARRAFDSAPGSAEARQLLEAACSDAGKWAPLAEALEQRAVTLRAQLPSASRGRKKKTDVQAAERLASDVRTLELELADLLETRLGRPTDAQVVLRRLVEADPSDTVAVEHLNRLLRSSGDRDNLRWLMDLRINNADPDVQSQLLHEWARIEEEVFDAPERASALYGRVLELDPTDREALTQLTRLVLAEGQAEEAVSVMRQHRDLLDGVQRARIEEELAEVLLYRLEQPDAALQSALSALAGFEGADPASAQRAIDVLQRLVQVDSTKREAAGALARVYQSRQERRKEADALGVLLSVEEEPSARLALYQRGVGVFEELDSFNAAFELMLKALRDFPERMQLWDHASGLASRAGRAAELAEAYRDVLRGDVEPELRKELCQRAATLHEEQLGDPVGATPYLEQVLAADPGDFEAFSRLKQILTSNQRWGELQSLYDQMLTELADDSARLDVLSEVAMVCEEFMDDPRAAQGYYEQMLEVDATHGGALKALDRLYGRHEQYSKLSQLLDRRLQLAVGDDATVLRLRAATLCLDQLHQPERALERVEEVLQDDLNNSRAREIAERILGIGSLKYRASELLERVYDSRDDARELVRVLEAQLDAARALEQRDETGETLLLERIASLRYGRLKDDSGALTALGEYLPRRPEDAEARRQLLEVGTRLNEQARVANVLEQAAAATSDLVLRGELLMEAGKLREQVLDDSERAQAIYRRVIELDPQDAHLVLPAAKALQRLYDKAQAIAPWVEALRLELKHETDPTIRLALLEKIARLSEERLHDRDAAIHAWKARVEEEPNDLLSLQSLDRLYTEAERYEELVPVLQHASEVVQEPSERQALMLRVATLQGEKLGDTASAIDSYRAVQDAFGSSLATLRALALLLQQAKRWDDLADCLQAQLEHLDSETERWDVLIALGDLQREHLNNVPLALDAYREVAEACPTHEGMRSALLLVLGSDDVVHQREAAQVLVPVYEAEKNAEKLIDVYRVLIETADDPVERLEFIRLSIDLADNQLQDKGLAFELALRAVSEGAGHTDLVPWLARLESLAEQTGRRKEQVDLYSRIVESVFDGDVQYSLLFRTATLCRDALDDAPKALTYFRRAVDARPDSGEALLALEQAYIQSDAHEPLLDVLAQRADIASTDDERRELMLRRGELLDQKLGRRTEAIDAYERVLDLGMNTSAVDALHRLYDTEKRFERELELYQRQLDNEPRLAADIHVRMAKVAAEKLKDGQRAFEELEAALAAEPAYPAAMAELERLMNEPDGDAEQHARAAMVLEPIYLSRGDYDKVMGSIRAQLEQGDAVERRELLQRLAQLCEEQKEDYVGALEIFAQLLSDDLTDEETIGELERLAKVGDAKDRLADIYRVELEKVDEQDPSTGALCVRTGELYRELEKPDLALKFYRRALTFEPDSPELFGAIDALLTQTKQVEARVELYQDALEHRLDPDDRVLLLHTLGELYTDQLDKKEEAIGVYVQALQFDEDDTLALDNLSRLYYDTERYEELYSLVRRRAETALEDEQAIAFRIALAKLCKNELGDNERAVEQLEEIVRLDPTSEVALDELDALRRVPSLRARVVDILRPIYERSDDWRRIVALNEDRFELAELPGDKVLVLRETAELWEHRGGEREKAMQVLVVAVRIAPDDDEVRHELERLAEMTSQWDLVSEVYTEVLGGTSVTDEDSAAAAAPGVPEHAATEIWLKLAQIHDGPRNDPRAALLAYEQVRQLDPSQLEPIERMEALAILLSDWEVLDQVLIAKADLVFDDDERASLWRRVGEGRRDMLNQPKAAIEAYERALELEPDSGFTVDCLIDLYEEQGNPRRLVELYERRVELCEVDESEQCYSLLVRAAEVTEEKFHDSQRTIDFYNQALHQKPEDKEVLTRLNRLYRSEKLWPELLENLRLRAELADDLTQRSVFRGEMGDLLSREMDSFGEALEMYQLVLEQEPNNEEVRRKVLTIGEQHEELREPVAAILIPALVASDAHDARAHVLELRLTVETDAAIRAGTLRAIADVQLKQLEDKSAGLGALLRAMAEVPEDSEIHAEIELLCDETAEWGSYANALSERAQTTFDAEVGRELLSRLGRICRDKLNEPLRAIEAYARAVEQVGDEPELLLDLDGLYEQTKNWAQLRDIVERRTLVAESDEQRADLYARLASIQLEHFSEAGQALASLRNALDLNPLHDGAKTQLEALTNDRDLFEEASEVLEQVYRSRGTTDALAPLYEKRVQFAETTEERQEMRKALARVLEDELGNPDAALRVLQQGLGEDLTDSELVAEVERLAAVSGDWKTAASALDAALEGQSELEPTLARDLSLRLAEWLSERVDDPTAAERALERALHVEPDNDELLAQLELLQGRPGRELARVETLRRRAQLQLDPHSREDLCRQAFDLASAEGETDIAERVLRELLEGDPEHPWALTELSRLREQAGDKQELFALLERRIQIALSGTEASELRHRAAKLAKEELQRPEAAVVLYEQLFEDDPMDVAASQALRELYSATAAHEKLSELLERLIDIADDAERQTALRLELARLRSEHFDDTDSAIELLRTVVADEPGHQQAVDTLTELYEKQERFEDLSLLFLDRISAYGDQGVYRERAECELRLADLYEHKLHDKERAASVLQDLLARDETNRGALGALVRLQLEQGHEREAAETLGRMLNCSEDAEKVDVALRLCDLYEKLEEPEAAAEALEEAFLAQPTHRGVRDKLRALYQRVGNHGKLAELMVVDAEHTEESAEQAKLLIAAAQIYLGEGADAGRAIELLQAADRVNPEDRSLLMLLCDAYTEAGRPAEAISTLERVVESYGGRRSRELADVHRRLAHAYRAQHEPERAVAELDKAFRMEPGNVSVLKALGELSLEIGDLKRAQQMFRALLLQKLDRDSPITKAEVYYYLGAVHERLEERSKAIQMLERAVQTDPALQKARDLLDELQG